MSPHKAPLAGGVRGWAGCPGPSCPSPALQSWPHPRSALVEKGASLLGPQGMGTAVVPALPWRDRAKANPALGLGGRGGAAGTGCPKRREHTGGSCVGLGLPDFLLTWFWG